MTEAEMLDETRAFNESLEALLATQPRSNWFANCFLPGSGEERRAASIFMEARWRQAGNETTLSLWDEGIHAYTAFPIEIGRRSRAEQNAFLKGS